MDNIEVKWNNEFLTVIGDYSDHSALDILGVLEAVKKMLCETCLHVGSIDFNINLGPDLEFAIAVVDLFKEGISHGLKAVTMIALIDRYIIHTHITFHGSALNATVH